MQIIVIGSMQVQNAFWGTKLFMHNGKESIMNNELEDIEAFRKRYTYVYLDWLLLYNVYTNCNISLFSILFV